MAKQMKKRALIFLISSFLSAVGDAALVFAVPVGLGLETRDLRSAVLMWLIPAVAMFFSSFLSARMERRYESARADYGKLLLAIAALELVISVLALILRTPIQTVVLIAGFVFFYALAKEGIPRILYVVSVYRYFVEPREYTRIMGVSYGLNIAATLVGTCLAGWLVSAGSWRVALLFDALTFVVFGLAVLFMGRDPSAAAEAPGGSSETDPKSLPVQTEERLAWIQLLVPLLFGVNALIWNYLPLLNEELAVLNSTTSIFVVGILRMPGMLSGLFAQRIFQAISIEKVIVGLPALFLGMSLAFSAAPSIAVFCALVVLQGILSGLYWPADFSVRNELSGVSLIRFNTHVLRKLALTQFAGCLLALWIFSPSGPGVGAITGVAITLIGISILYHWGIDRRRRVALQVATVCLVLFSFSACTHSSDEREHKVLLPSISQNLELRPGLTYAATAILNDTSAHLVRVSRDLTIQGEVLSRFESLDGGKHYVLELNPEYRSARGESLTADDVRFSVQFYLSQKRTLSGALSAIDGSKACQSESCVLPGVQIVSPSRLRVTLAEPDLKWVDKLASPWLVLLKKGKPTTERVGSCVVPYQTGRGELLGCDSSGIHVRIGTRLVVVSKSEPGVESPTGASKLLTESPNQEVSPSLTVLTAFANPASKRLNTAERIQVLSSIRAASREIAAGVHLKHAGLLTPEWLGVKAPSDLLNVPSKPGAGCPRGESIKILLDTSLPRLPVLRQALQAAIGCPVEFSLTTADTYFQEFAKADVGIAWFTPDFLDLYDIFAPFDCSVANACSFNWHDADLQRRIGMIRKSGYQGDADKNTALGIERLLLKKGYAAPIAEMNWWIRKLDGAIQSVHPAGLFQVRVSDFL